MSLTCIFVQELDIAAVKALFNAIEPEDKSIDTIDGQKQWIQNVQKSRPVAERLLNTDIDITSTRGRLMVSLRLDILILMNMFYVYVCALLTGVFETCFAYLTHG